MQVRKLGQTLYAVTELKYWSDTQAALLREELAKVHSYCAVRVQEIKKKKYISVSSRNFKDFVKCIHSLGYYESQKEEGRW